jgi:hypothetical protein
MGDIMQDSPWDDDSEIVENDSEKQNSEENLTLESSVKKMVSEVSNELRMVHSGKYDEKRAIKTAALALKAQIDLAEFLSDVEGTAKGMKNEVKAVEAEVYFDHRSSAEKKMSEAALQQLIAKDKRTVVAEAKAVEAEKVAKKWGIVFGTMKEAHIFFRNLGKNDWSI